MKPKLTTVNNEGEEVEVPARWEVCHSCNGQGASSAYLGAFTADDMHELGEDFREDYMEGRYDKVCQECNGRTTVPEIDRNRASEEQQRWYDEQQRQVAMSRAIEAAERRAGA